MESPIAVSSRLDVPTVREIRQAILDVRATNPESVLAHLADAKLSHASTGD